MNADPDIGSAGHRTLTGRIGSWVGVVSALITVGLTVVNAYWSNQIKDRQADLEEQRIELEQGRERLERFSFVESLLEDLVSDVEPARSLKINLVNLALTTSEAENLWQGLQVSEDETVSSIGTSGAQILDLVHLVGQMNSAVRQDRLEAVDQLISEHRSNPQAIRQAISMLEEPRVDNLSPSGRINVMVFLRNTGMSAWSEAEVRRARAALEAMKARNADGTAPFGSQTQEVLESVEQHLENVERG